VYGWLAYGPCVVALCRPVSCCVLQVRAVHPVLGEGVQCRLLDTAACSYVISMIGWLIKIG
jgi:hypothetical protein